MFDQQLSSPAAFTGLETGLLPAVQPALDLSVSELESLEAPDFWSTAAGVGVGTVVGYGVVWGAVAFT